MKNKYFIVMETDMGSSLTVSNVVRKHYNQIMLNEIKFNRVTVNIDQFTVKINVILAIDDG